MREKKESLEGVGLGRIRRAGTRKRSRWNVVREMSRRANQDGPL